MELKFLGFQHPMEHQHNTLPVAVAAPVVMVV
jgi:hypothetical protein